MPDAIGVVERVDLQIYKDSALSFDVEWWETLAYTEPIAIGASVTLLKLNGVVYNLETLGMATRQANVIHIALPPAWTGTLPAMDGMWSCEATDAVSGEERMLVRGAVRVSE